MNMTMALPTTPELCAPVQPRGTGKPDAETLETLRLALEQGNAKERVAAEAYVDALILETVAARLLATPHGPVPRFLDQIKLSVRSFDRVLR